VLTGRHSPFLTGDNGRVAAGISLGYFAMDARMAEAGPGSMTKCATTKLSRAYCLALALFVGLQIADVITTNHALTIPGIWEVNPLMAWS
jgi:hypothetical protein